MWVIFAMTACHGARYSKVVGLVDEIYATVSKRMSVRGEPEIGSLTTELNYLCAVIDAHAGGEARGDLRVIRVDIELMCEELSKVEERYLDQIFKKLKREDLEKDLDRLLGRRNVDQDEVERVQAERRAADAEVLDPDECEKETRAVGEKMLKELKRWRVELKALG